MRTLGIAIWSMFSGTLLWAQTASIIPATPATPTAHPWYVKAEYGPWMICVKSYADGHEANEKNAKAFAEALAQEIREKYRVPAYLFERGSNEAAAERARHAQDLAKRRQQRAEEQAGFNAVLNQAKLEAAAKGLDFLDSKATIRAPRVEIPSQWAVLIGGWPTMDAARKELDKIKQWQPPSDKKLMDTQFIVRSQDGQSNGEMIHINPFVTSMVVPNPVAPRPVDPESEAETKFVLKLNEDEPHSVLKIQKNWTICVKTFKPPMDLKTRQQSFLARMFDPKPDAMTASAVQARSMAEMLRNNKWQHNNPGAPKVGPFDAYVLHTRYGSLVCVGQFDGPNDPALLKMQSELGMIKFEVRVAEGDKTKLEAQNARIFDHFYAMKVRD